MIVYGWHVLQPLKQSFEQMQLPTRVYYYTTSLIHHNRSLVALFIKTICQALSFNVCIAVICPCLASWMESAGTRPISQNPHETNTLNIAQKNHNFAAGHNHTPSTSGTVYMDVGFLRSILSIEQVCRTSLLTACIKDASWALNGCTRLFLLLMWS